GGHQRLLLRRGPAGVRPPGGRAADHHAKARRSAVAPARARVRVTTGLLVAGAGLVGLGTIGAAFRSTFRDAVRAQAAGAALIAVGGFWALGAGDRVGSAFTSAFE